jgi:threonine aldolase
MRRFMCRAPVGDEEFAEDPTVTELELAVAELTGKEAALFMPSGTMCNVVAYFVHCGPEDEILVHKDSHPVYSHYAGPTVPGRASLRLFSGERGVITGAEVANVLREAPNPHRIRLLSLENTHNRSGGSIWPVATVEDTCRVAHANGLATHLDGARLLNAVVASGTSAAAFCAPFDSVWIDLTKGLGCPTGAVLAGNESFIAESRRGKYLSGGVMHKAGIAAAAGVYALRHHIDRLQDDHARAAELADGLAKMRGVQLAQDHVETNMVYFDIDRTGLTAPQLLTLAESQGVRLKVVSDTRLRAATHLEISADDVCRTLEVMQEAISART